MSSEVTPDLLAVALQRLEAIQANESEPISDDECRKRAQEVAETSLQAMVVCTKYLLSNNAEARINGLGSFHLEGDEIRFVPESDVIQYVLLKQREADEVQLSLRNAFVAMLSEARDLIELLEMPSDQAATTSMPHQGDLVEQVFESSLPNNFAATASDLLDDIIGELNEAGFQIEVSPPSFVDQSRLRAGDLADSARDLVDQGRERVRSTVSRIRGEESTFRDIKEENAG